MECNYPMADTPKTSGAVPEKDKNLDINGAELAEKEPVKEKKAELPPF
jgi:hypothetical protein